MMKQRKKYSFVLNYGMSSSHVRLDSKLYNTLETIASNRFAPGHSENDSAEIKQAPKINMDSDSIQLLDII